MIDIKKLKPLGVVLILAFSVVALIVCFTADMGVPKPYESAHDADWYRQSPDTLESLLAEARENVFPALTGIREASVDAQAMRVSVTVEKKQLDKARLVLERDFGTELFEFKEYA